MLRIGVRFYRKMLAKCQQNRKTVTLRKTNIVYDLLGNDRKAIYKQQKSDIGSADTTRWSAGLSLQ